MSPSALILTLEQSALIPTYKEKWKNILVSSDIIDRSKAKTNIILLYRYLGLPKPRIIFVDTPHIAMDLILKECLELFKKKYTIDQLHWLILWEVFYETWGGSVWSKLRYSNKTKLLIGDCLKPLSILEKLTEKFALEREFPIKEHGIYQIKTLKSHLTLSEEAFLYFRELWDRVEYKIIKSLTSHSFRKFLR